MSTDIFLLARKVLRRLDRMLSRASPHNSITEISITEILVKKQVFDDHPFGLLDIGCSGGIAWFGRNFEPSLRAVGVDPLKAEIDRLREAEANPNVDYVNAFVGLSKDHQSSIEQGSHDPIGANPWERLSAGQAVKIMRKGMSANERLSVLNDWQNLSLTNGGKRVSIDRLVQDKGLEDLDFIKIDVDGDDLNVLRSAESIVRSSPVLGMMLEVNFFGSGSKFDHTFHNTDRLMREWGFELFDLGVRKYSAAALPGQFTHHIPSETGYGRPYQGDAIYLRDPLWRHKNIESLCPALNVHKLLKLACLFQCFGLPDHAAEIVKAYAPKLSSICNPDEILDLLAKSVSPGVKSYADYVGRFRADPTSFYPR